jgi:hypothetical protein
MSEEELDLFQLPPFTWHSFAQVMRSKMIQLHPLRAPPNDIPDDVLGNPSESASAIWHSLRELVSRPEVWLAQCVCESNESLPYRKLVESAKAEEQRIRIRTSQSASIDGENLNALGRRQLFRLS